MGYYSKKFTVAAASTGERDAAGIPIVLTRTWNGHVKDETVAIWLRAKGLKIANVSYHGVHKARATVHADGHRVEA